VRSSGQVAAIVRYRQKNDLVDTRGDDRTNCEGGAERKNLGGEGKTERNHKSVSPSAKEISSQKSTQYLSATKGDGWKQIPGAPAASGGDIAQGEGRGRERRLGGGAGSRGRGSRKYKGWIAPPRKGGKKDEAIWVLAMLEGDADDSEIRAGVGSQEKQKIDGVQKNRAQGFKRGF